LDLGPARETIAVGAGDARINLSRHEVPDAYLAGISFKEAAKSVIGLDLRVARENNGAEIYGLVGMDILSQCVFQIDPDRGEFTLLKSVPKDAGKPIPLDLEDGRPHVTLELAGPGEARFLLDTGSFGQLSGALNKSTWDELDSKGLLRRRGIIRELTIAGFHETDLGSCPSISFAGSTTHNPVFFLFQENILGLGYLSRFKSVFDFPNRALYLQKCQYFDHRDEVDLSGIEFKQQHGSKIIRSVAAASAGEKAGLTSGDVLVTVDGQPAANLNIYEVRRLLSLEGKRRLTLLRGLSEVIRVELELRR
jgi:hypothetical protein